MSKARPQSSARRTQRIMMGLQNSKPNSTKRQGMRLQVINISIFPKKKGRKSNRQKWIEKLPFHLGKSKFIYHKN